MSSTYGEPKITVDEVLKRLNWASMSVPAPTTESSEVKMFLAALSPEELLRIRATAALLRSHHTRVLEYLNVVLDAVNDNGYLRPVRIK